ncbi:LysR family transcriptional regulator [Agarivorans sp. 1_MG-2023]|uniref:LysR family transcriptional regulator n=1 Tax=Agarivorans sp. 1_MG-2023 TaxID=3062634 RepID=UPI0026E41A01|nr:LysR family transcriptional regulator [Agarivorans sp. 1_MG-2023]MDO6762771.1 LysR substrate-binding domain-containing protein [Agarivorans sp. 1_MG-2023]
MFNGVLDFVTVVEEGSFTAAAEKLVSSKASISQRVSDLETRLGVQLLYRSTRKLRLTEAGERYYQSCQQGLELLEDGALAAQQLQHHLQGKVVINSLGGIFAEQWLAPALMAFRQEHPNIDIELDLSSQREDLLSSPFDIVFRMGALPNSNLQVRILSQMNTYVVASPSYFERYGKPKHPDELKQHQCVCGTVSQWPFVQREQKLMTTVSGPFSCPNGHVLKQAALQGLGLIRTHEMYLREALAEGSLEAVLQDWQELSQPLWMVFPPARFRSKRVSMLADWLVAYAVAHPI